KEDLKNSLNLIVPHVTNLEVSPLGETHRLISFHVGNRWLEAAMESDGTLRVLALLTALYQDPPRALLAFEEPELMVHPGALPALCEIIEEASLRSQIIITTHSPDMIARFKADDLRIVERTEQGTKIGLIDEVQRQVIEDQLFSGGDLLRI